MMQLLVWLILGVILGAEGRRNFIPHQRGKVQQYASSEILPNHSPMTSASSSSSSSSSSEEEKIYFSSWELTMMSQVLVDISINRCEAFVDDQARDFKNYVERVVEGAPQRGVISKNFMELYDSLVECLRLSTEAANREQYAKAIQLANLNEKNIDFNSNTPQIVEQSHIVAVISLDHPSNSTSLDEIHSGSTPTPSSKTTISTTLKPEPSHKHRKPSKKVNSIMNSVGHLFTELYDNTISIFSSIFGRKKRGSNWETDHDDEDDDVGRDDNDDNVAQGVAPARRVHSNIRSSQEDNSKESSNSDEVSANLKPIRNGKDNKKTNFRHNRFLKLGEKHFRSVLKSMTAIALRSCPIQMAPHMTEVKTALKEIFAHLKQASEGKEDKKGLSDSEPFPLNFQVQRKVHQCSKEVGVALAKI